MNVFFTIVVLGVAALWIMTVLRRLARLRDEIKMVWQRLQADQSNEAVKVVYNKHVVKYNDALDSFPAYLVGPLFGFKPARRFN